MKRRAEQFGETRRRITEATVELHRTIGPAATTISEVARRAGVQRVTVYSHFPDEAALFVACSQHWRALHPAPDPTAWRATPDAGERLRLGLGQLYAWYRETDPMTTNVLRDAPHLPALREVVDQGLGRYLEAARGVLAEPFRARGRRRARVRAALEAIVDVFTWGHLSALGDDEAAELGARLVEAAAESTSAARPSPRDPARTRR